MTALGVVLAAVYEDRSAAQPLPRDRFIPEKSRVQRVIMLHQVRATLPTLGEAGLQTDVTRVQRFEIIDAFGAGQWSRTLELVTLVAEVARSAFARLDAEFGILVGGEKLRSLREALTGWVMAGYDENPKVPSEDQRHRLCGRLVERARQLDRTALSEPAFVGQLTPYYLSLSWADDDHRSEYLLGDERRPALSDPHRRTVSAGTDRDCFSRYTSYYSLKSRSRSMSTARLEQWLADTSPVEVAEHELRRSSQPFGLDQEAHRQVLPMTYFALYEPTLDQRTTDDGAESAPSVVDDRSRPDHAARSLVDSVEVLQRLTSTYVRFLRRHRAWQLGSDSEGLQRSVLRKLWNDLHRLERETESAASLGWYVGKFKVALDSYAKGLGMEPVLLDPVEDSRWSNRGGGPDDDEGSSGAELLTVALRLLSELDPEKLLSWAVRSAAERDAVAAELGIEARPLLDRDGYGAPAARRILLTAVMLLVGLGAGGDR